MKETWKGTYHYSSKKAIVKEKQVGFEMTFVKKEDGTFRGEIIDLEAGMKGTGTVTGTITDSTIEFVKQMPIRTVVTNKRGSEEDETRTHRPIYYKGGIVKGKANGSWKFKAGLVRWKNLMGLSFGNKGGWEMTKVD